MVLIPNKREFLARRMCGAGLTALLERRAARRPGLLVLTYHRVEDPSGSPYYRPIASATAEALEAQLRALSRTHRVVTLDEAVAMADDGFRAGGPSALVTFDDGYRDNVEVALPVLRALGVPAAFFLATGFLEEPRLPWWDHIAYVVRHSGADVLRLDEPEPVEIDLRRTPREEAISRVVWSYFGHLGGDERAFRAHLEDRAGVHVDDAALGRALFMTWDDARALVASGMSVGSHGRSHRDLARLTEVEQRDELAGSKRVLERELGREVAALAYPYGWPGTYDETTRRLAREAGYRLAFSSAEGVNRPGAADRFAALRLGVGSADSPTLLRARWALHGALGRSFL